MKLSKGFTLHPRAFSLHAKHGFTLHPRAFSLHAKHGFTLIELLVVVAIIGVLASIVLGSLSNARANARDARRESDVKTIQNALELYHLDNGQYPILSWTTSDEAAWTTNFLTPLGLANIIDPVNESPVGTRAYEANTNYVYSYFDSGYGCPGQWYMIIYNLETDEFGVANPDSPGVTACSGSSFNYTGSITRGMSPVQ